MAQNPCNLLAFRKFERRDETSRRARIFTQSKLKQHEAIQLGYVGFFKMNDHSSQNFTPTHWISLVLFHYLFITICIGVLLGSLPAQATVIEWDASGKPVVQDRTSKNPFQSSKEPSSQNSQSPWAKNANADLERALNQKLSREIALKFSGHDGVMAAGLTALEFIDLFEALVKQESAFNHKAVSEKGAQGLGQLMPDTAAELQVHNPFDPYENLNASATYFTQLLGKFKRADLALAAYNAGPTRVKKLGRVPRLEETQNYIRAVLRQAGQPVPDLPEMQHVSNRRSEPQEGSERLETSSKAPAGVPLTGDVSVWEF